jgi:hypothetical protein
MTRKIVSVFVILVFAAAAAPAISAHHSHAPYDTSVLLQIQGTITKIEWRNPHMWVEVAVPGKDGKIETWGFEASGTAATIEEGISPTWFKVGATVKLIGHPARIPEKVAPGCPLGKCEALLMGVEYDGKFYGRNPSNETYGSKTY